MWIQELLDIGETLAENLQRVGFGNVKSFCTAGSVAIAVICILAVLLHIISKVFKSPFSYPYFIHDFDVSGKRGPQIDDLLDEFLIDGNFECIQNHQKKIEQWKQESCQRIAHSLMKKYRNQQYLHAVDDSRAFMFHFVRLKTKYRQRNYVKTPYKAYIRTHCFAYNYEYIQHRYNDLADISFECTLRTYHSKNQRKLATRELREKIMIRDNYTCQLCGKYMPDEVGLQIDHIIPIAKGGKTVASNLRVLCSKCNGSKSDKMPV